MSGTHFTQASRPFNDASLDMGRPPQTSRAYSRTGRAALAAGTLGTVGDDTAREDVQRNIEVRNADGYDADVVHADILAASEVWAQRRAPTEDEVRAEALRQSRLRRWQTPR